MGWGFVVLELGMTISLLLSPLLLLSLASSPSSDADSPMEAEAESSSDAVVAAAVPSGTDPVVSAPALAARRA